jgi:hypothetical protein
VFQTDISPGGVPGFLKRLVLMSVEIIEDKEQQNDHA